MNIATTILSCDEDSLMFYPQTFCTVSTSTGNILECKTDICVHTILDEVSGMKFKVYRPVSPEILVGDTIEYITGIYIPSLGEVA